MKISVFIVLIMSVLCLFGSSKNIIEGERGVPIKGHDGMVVTSHYLATQSAIDVLKEGGNAIDASVVAGFVLAVVQPRSGNIGGGGFMMISSESKNEVVGIDYREKAPSGAKENMFLDEAGDVDKNRARYSHLSSGVPGTVSGFLMALKKYGTISIQRALEPAIKLAKDGFIVPARFSEGLKKKEKLLKKNDEARKKFYKGNGGFYEIGDRFIQKDLAETLQRISDEGIDGFYQGKTAELIVKSMEKNGGLITKSDLERYQAVIRKPIHGKYRGHDVYSMAPPSSGGIHIVQILNILENFNIGVSGLNSAKTMNIMAEAMKRAYADRSKHLGDTDFYNVPIEELTDKKYAKEIAMDIDYPHITPSSEIRPMSVDGYESDETTHFSIADKYGNAVSNTYTINFSYGSGKVVEGAGFLLNNEMDDFSSKPGVPNGFGLIGGVANKIEANKRMLSSMSPTIVKKDNKNFLLVGSPGGSRIITTTLQVILNVIDHGLNIQSAVDSPRMHHQWSPDEIRIEQGFSLDTLNILKKMGYKINLKSSMGAANSIMIKDEFFYGGVDRRRDTGFGLGL